MMDVLMPQLGETVTEGKITAWFKKVGDTVAPGDNLFEIETDKTAMEVPATGAGLLTEIRVAAGADAVPVGAVVAVITASDEVPMSARIVPVEAVAAVVDQSIAPTPVAPMGHRPPGSLDPFHEVSTSELAKFGNGAAITPVARRLAAEAGIDLASIEGSGPGGRVVKGDVLARIQSGASRVPAPALFAAFAPDQEFEEVQLDSMRRAIARRLVQAKLTIPHFYLSVDIEVDRLLKMREEANATAAKTAAGAPAFKLSINDFMVKALALALQQVPAANSAWADDRILRFKHTDIGIAVALENGLITPLVRNAETKSLLATSNEIKGLVARARDRKLVPAEYNGGVSAVSNLGYYGVKEFAAVINPPHATILAVGAVRRQPVETADGGFKFTSQITVTLSCDHRIVDGVIGAELLEAFRSHMEAPIRIIT
jgi:pyruvate dehydrogenase E2 component (dihydrolipoamide acetyltransferase)